MLIAGLTGSIAMGKSTIATMLNELGFPVFDADAAVRDYYAAEGAQVIEATFPGVVVDGVVDRERLGARVLSDDAAIRRLEAIVHPAVGERRAKFLEAARASGRRMAVLDIPLLFETGGEKRVDLVIVVSAKPEQQRARALARPGMTEDKFEAILARQTPDDEKRRRAQVVIDTSGTLEDSRAQVERLARALATAPEGTNPFA